MLHVDFLTKLSGLAKKETAAKFHYASKSFKENSLKKRTACSRDAGDQKGEESPTTKLQWEQPVQGDGEPYLLCASPSPKYLAIGRRDDNQPQHPPPAL